MRPIACWLACSLAVLLASCGGGGSDGGNPSSNPPSNPPAPTPQQQTIAFATPGPLTRALADSTFTNTASGGAGTGAISYQSSNPSVATVNGSGVVTFLAAGETTITATKAADASYLSATASYALTITAPVPAQPQTISFATAGPVTRTIADGGFTNVASGGAGTGAIAYQSANTAVASVNASGVVTFVAPGTTVITANKAADANWLAASASYTLVITAEPAVSFQAWMGATDTQVTFAPSAATLEFLRSTQLDCDAANFVACSGTAASMAGATPADSTAHLNRAVNWWLRRGNSVSPPLRINPEVFEPRYSNLAASWRGKLWVVSGRAGTWYGDVWNSSGGNHWTRVAATGAPNLYASAMVVFNDRLWVLGGQTGSPFSGVVWSNQVWSTADGINWQRGPDAPWPGRSDHSALVFNGRMWVIGGGTGLSIEGGDDAWSTADGINWVEETHDGPFAKGARAAVLGGRIYTLMGYENGAASDDVYSSADGRNWRLETGSLPMPFRDRAMIGTLNGRLYLAGGVTDIWVGTKTNEVWSSANGIDWIQETPQAGFSPRALAGHAVHESRLWILGGQIGDFDYLLGPARSLAAGDVWSTANGASWTEHSPHADGIWQGSHNAVVHSGRIWLVGGKDSQPRNDTWSSSDGMNWTRQPSGSTYPKRELPAFALHDGEFWIAGGSVEDENGWTDMTDVWHSPDGIDWTRATDDAAFLPRFNFAIVSFNDQLYAIGGIVPGEIFATSDVFTSTDGANWTQVPQVVPFTGSYGPFEALVFNGRLYLIGAGWGTQSDVWSTADGSTWREEGTGTPRKDRIRGTAAVHDGRIWVTGGGIQVPDGIPGSAGTVLDVTNELYSSDDGINWVTVAGGPRYGGRAETSMLSFDGKLWVLGGSDVSKLLNDVWYSADGGVNWRMRYTGTIQYP
jgi:hypothetical protein